MNEDLVFMKQALFEAEQAYEEGEVPVGAVVVLNGKIIGRGHNRTESLYDATAHAEIIAISAAANYLKNWRLVGAKLYVTVEPCIMCAGAIVLSRIEEVIYATEEPKFGGVVSKAHIFDIEGLNHRVKYRKGPLSDEAAALLKDFFKKKRNSK